MNKYVFKEYNTDYKRFFSLEKKKLNRVLGSKIRIEHVGSTAIQNLGGKGILDILVGVENNKIKMTKQKLEEAGYEFRQKASARYRLFFRRDYPYDGTIRRIHIHLTKLNGEDWKEIVSFREYLLKHPNEITNYAKLKKKAVKIAKGNGDTYKKFKEEFIKNIIKLSKK